MKTHKIVYMLLGIVITIGGVLSLIDNDESEDSASTNNAVKTVSKKEQTKPKPYESSLEFVIEETENTGPPQPPIENTVKLVDWIKDNIGEFEDDVLKALSEIDPFEWRPALITPVLVQHFAAKGDVFAAIDTLETLRGSRADFLHREIVAYLLAEHSAKEDPSQLMAFLDDDKNNEISLRARYELGARMVDEKEDRGSVIALIQARPDDKVRTSYLEGALGRWGVEDLGSLKLFLAEAPASQDLDRGYEIASNYMKNTAPLEALQWAGMITASDRRTEATILAARECAKKKPENYNEWLTTLKDENLKKVLLEEITQY